MIYPAVLALLTITPITLAVWRLRHRSGGWRRLVLLSTIPVPWIAELIWGLAHHRDPQHPIKVTASLELMFWAVLGLTCVAGLGAFSVLKECRVTVALLSLLHAILAFLIGILSIMTISGNWI